MSDLDASTPRVFLIRHGETEWTKTGRYTSTTDLALTAHGEHQVRASSTQLVGPGKLLDPARIMRVVVSPRKRAHQTFKLLFGGEGSSDIDHKVTFTEAIAEWNYGDYEGLTAGEIRGLRKKKGLDERRDYNIWVDGCESGESPEQVTQRLDRLIEELQELQAPYMHGDEPADIILVAHGLILRAFFKRWIKVPLGEDLPMMMSPGAIGILGYKSHNVKKPGFFVGVALPLKE